MATDFTRTMRHLQDEDLVEIVESEGDEAFRADAIEAARIELVRRNISDERAKELRRDLTTSQISHQRRADEPLGNLGWIILVLAGPTILPIGYAVIAFITGYHRKGKDALSAIVGGYLLWGLIALFIMTLVYFFD